MASFGSEFVLNEKVVRCLNGVLVFGGSPKDRVMSHAARDKRSRARARQVQSWQSSDPRSGLSEPRSWAQTKTITRLRNKQTICSGRVMKILLSHFFSSNRNSSI